MPLINWYLEFQLCAGSDGARKSGSSSSVFSLFNLKEKSRFWSESVIRSGDMFFLLPSRICNRKVLPLDFIVLSISCVFPPQSLRICSLPVLAEWLLWTSPMQVVITGLSEMMRWVHFMRFGLTSIFFFLFQCFLYLRKTKWEFRFSATFREFIMFHFHYHVEILDPVLGGTLIIYIALKFEHYYIMKSKESLQFYV